MKHKLLLLPLLLLVITGCKNNKTFETLTCTYENNIEGAKYKTTITADVNSDGIIINAVSSMNFEDKSLADEMCENFEAVSDAKNVTCKDKNITIKKYHKSLSGDKELTKETFLEYMDNKNYSCK